MALAGALSHSGREVIDALCFSGSPMRAGGARVAAALVGHS
jgi:hypothetical protein